MKHLLASTALVLAGSLAVPATAAAGFASKPAAEWSKEDAMAAWTDSPWVVTQKVFPSALRAPDAGAAKPINTIRADVRIRWYSSGLLRHARAKLSEGISPEQAADMTRPSDRYYMISVSSDEVLSIFDAVEEKDLFAKTSLTVDDKKYPLAVVQRPTALGGPEALFFFERGEGIPAGAKTAVFETEAGDLSLKAKFKLSKMEWLGKRDLDGDTGEISAVEKIRREVQAAVLAGGTRGFMRAVTDVRLEKKGEKQKDRPWAAYVFYDAAADEAGKAEGETVDAAARKLGMASRIGEWSKKNGNKLQAIVFVDPKSGKAVDYVLGPDAEKVSTMKPEGAAAFFKKKLTSADKSPSAKKSPSKKKSGG